MANLMADETLDLDGNSFVAVALRHGLLRRHHVEKILDHARRHNVEPADAALTLSVLQPYEVDAVSLLLRPGELAPGYSLTELIGCGSGGMVFRAHQSALGRDVALKTINFRSRMTTSESRIQREARAIARLHHPNIVAAYDSGFYQGRFCIAMEFVEGETLAAFIARHDKLSEAVAWRIARQVASALSHASDQGIIHRDIKPANLLLTKPPAGTELPSDVPFVKVADFGLALEDEAKTSPQLTASGATLGTPAYVAPEQLHDTHVDVRADIYALGATVFHMLTGKAPCADRSPMKAILQKTVGDQTWREDLPATISPASAQLFRHMTELQPDDRLVDHAQLMDRIDQLLTRLPGDTTSPPEGRQVGRTGRCTVTSGRAWLAKSLFFAAALLTGVAVAVIVAGYRHHVPPSDAAMTSDAPMVSQWVGSGIPEPLFNGESVPLFRQSGRWTAVSANDGARVLRGAEGSQMAIPLKIKGSDTSDVRMRLRLNSDGDAVTELALIDAVDADELAMIRFSNGTASLAHSPSERKMNVPLRKSTDGSVVYQQVQISRQRDRIHVVVNGKPIGDFACRSTGAYGVMLRCKIGEADFADLDMVSLLPAS